MSFDALQSGTVVIYPYLWQWQADRGETEGRKERPTAVGLRMSRPGGDALILFAITTRQPPPERWAIEVPDAEKRRAGLDASLRQWIVLDESNEDMVRGSFYLTPEPPLGRFSARFFGPLVQQVIDRWREVRRVSRR